MNEKRPPFAPIERAVEELKAGRFVVDDEDRENEGDLVLGEISDVMREVFATYEEPAVY